MSETQYSDLPCQKHVKVSQDRCGGSLARTATTTGRRTQHGGGESGQRREGQEWLRLWTCGSLGSEQ